MTREKQQGWLYRIATNACLGFLEKRRDRTPIFADLQGTGGTGTQVQYRPGFALGHRLIPERGRWSLASAVFRCLRDAYR
jgi:DNA-directed RNA polymerase specialized sigma24 family protein